MNKLLSDPQLETWALEVVFSSYRQAEQGPSRNCSLYGHMCFTSCLLFFFFPSKISKQYAMKYYTKNSLHLTIG